MSHVIAQQAGDVIGVDIEPNRFWHELKLRSSNLQFVVADVCRLPFKDNTFNVVFAKNLLHHVAIPELALAEMKQVTRSGGMIVIVESNRYNPIKYIFGTLVAGHRHFTGKYFKQLLRQQFNEVKFISFDAHYYPVRTKLGKYLLIGLERVFERSPVLNKFLGVNVAVARK
jgi:ubiquinone/menaquinone biosynthesis C-methylase UbiE